MRKVVFDIETRNVFADVGKNDPALLDIALVAIYDSETNTYSSYLEEELSRLWPIIEHADMLIGFNSDHFDIPLLDKYYPGDLSQIKSLDILKEIKNSYGRRMRLSQIAAATLGEGKADDGMDAVEWWKNGEVDKIREYCINDVRITKEIYEYALQHNKLMFAEGGVEHTIELDTSNWEEKGDSKLTFTLPF